VVGDRVVEEMVNLWGCHVLVLGLIGGALYYQFSQGSWGYLLNGGGGDEALRLR
jgi:hypothetical protein